jgi:hypothetical protein
MNDEGMMGCSLVPDLKGSPNAQSEFPEARCATNLTSFSPLLITAYKLLTLPYYHLQLQGQAGLVASSPL